jgi:hypothetical protein
MIRTRKQQIVPQGRKPWNGALGTEAMHRNGSGRRQRGPGPQGKSETCRADFPAVGEEGAKKNGPMARWLDVSGND